LAAGHPLWKPWALDLADDVVTLLDRQRALGREIERACRIAAWALEVVVEECGGTFEEALAEAEREASGE
jgi:bifunctional ADP-heptose synthase (sugar kinase/adenylyltransferase)